MSMESREKPQRDIQTHEYMSTHAFFALSFFRFRSPCANRAYACAALFGACVCVCVFEGTQDDGTKEAIETIVRCASVWWELAPLHYCSTTFAWNGIIFTNHFTCWCVYRAILNQIKFFFFLLVLVLVEFLPLSVGLLCLTILVSLSISLVSLVLFEILFLDGRRTQPAANTREGAKARVLQQFIYDYCIFIFTFLFLWLVGWLRVPFVLSLHKL